jgi:hypothetical protein
MPKCLAFGVESNSVSRRAYQFGVEAPLHRSRRIIRKYCTYCKKKDYGKDEGYIDGIFGESQQVL